jgi:hypothetical protein
MFIVQVLAKTHVRSPIRSEARLGTIVAILTFREGMLGSDIGAGFDRRQEGSAMGGIGSDPKIVGRTLFSSRVTLVSWSMEP